MKAVLRWLVALLVTALLGCASPEASRRRGDGPGADPRNVSPEVELHGKRNPFYETPRKGSGT